MSITLPRHSIFFNFAVPGKVLSELGISAELRLKILEWFSRDTGRAPRWLALPKDLRKLHLESMTFADHHDESEKETQGQTPS